MDKPTITLVSVNSECVMSVIRFLKGQMTVSERLDYIGHARGCSQCQNFIRAVSYTLAHRESILRQLEMGGFNEPTDRG